MATLHSYFSCSCLLFLASSSFLFLYYYRRLLFILHSRECALGICCVAYVHAAVTESRASFSLPSPIHATVLPCQFLLPSWMRPLQMHLPARATIFLSSTYILARAPLSAARPKLGRVARLLHPRQPLVLLLHGGVVKVQVQAQPGHVVELHGLAATERLLHVPADDRRRL